VERALVIVVGSVNVDLVVRAERLPAPGETVTGGRFSRHGGGKGANQAVAAARLGARVAMVGAVGGDDLGEEALGLLEREGIDVAAVARLEAPTGVALIAVDAAGENQIAVAPGANAELDAAAVERTVRAAGPGAVLLSQEIPEAAVLAAARAAGGPIVLNPAPVRPLPGELAELGPILTPNAGEARELSGEEEPEAAARALAARTGAAVIVTLGARGVLVLDGGSVEELPAPAVDAVDTTGAGDAFNGALATALAEGRALRDAVTFAVAAAALSTRAGGAREGMPRRDEVSP
jgi:ribokinase